jgi:hypothetical protein
LLCLNQQDDPQPFSNYWLHMDGKSLETAAVDRARRFRESQSADGLLRGYRLKTAYFLNEYRAASGCRRCAVMPDGGLAPLTEPCGPLSAASPNN